ncbi:GNAT family N-acetyltransferase [Paenibacillus yanchengensis]|uniref:GNAT family N-acetyltransferase n=1 Tax=Paenibacillus yanchengensis TaxID=2035833 RepID=A0ABW4YNU6_9BACL
MYLQTERLIIRDFQVSDWQDVYSYTSNPIVMKYIPEGVFTEQQAEQFVKEQQSKGKPADKFAVVLKDREQLVGHLSFERYFGDHTYEIGWVFHPSYYNKGYATEAAQAVIAYGFQQLNLHRIVATCQPENPASYKVMEKIGMRKEGFFKQCIPYENGWWDELYYAILQSEWVERVAAKK